MALRLAELPLRGSDMLAFAAQIRCLRDDQGNRNQLDRKGPQVGKPAVGSPYGSGQAPGGVFLSPFIGLPK